MLSKLVHISEIGLIRALKEYNEYIIKLFITQIESGELNLKIVW